MNKFNIGDKVICVRPDGLFIKSLKKGKVYTIEQMSIMNTVRLKELPIKQWYKEDRFELYQPLPDELFKL